MVSESGTNLWRRGHPFPLLGALMTVLLGMIPMPSSAQICPPLQLPAMSHIAWDDDVAYEVTVREQGDGKLSIRVVGDILIFDSAHFSSMVRKVDKAPGNVVEVVFEARHVRILEPLALQSGRARVHAQVVSFEGLGLIALTRPPSAAADGLEINALQLDMRNALPLPLQVSVLPGAGRRVTIHAGELLIPGGESLQGDPASRWLWQRSSNFDGTAPDDLPPNWAVNVGKSGRQEALAAMRPVATWPAFTAYKIQKHHALAPFHKDNQQLLAQRIGELRPLLLELEQAEVLSNLDALLLLINHNLDRRGLGPAFVPSKDLVVALVDFENARKGARSRLTTLSTLIMSAHGSAQLNAADIAKARSGIQVLKDAQERRRAEIGETFTQLATLQQQGIKLGQQIEVEREVSRKRLNDLKEKEEDLGKIKMATTVVAIGASFIGTPAAGAAIAAGVGVVGDVVYSHNAGRPLNVETLQSIAEKNGELFKSMKDVQQAWDAHNADLAVLGEIYEGKIVGPKSGQKPLTKTDAASNAGRSAIDFAKKLRTAAAGVGSIPKPDSVTLNGVEAENLMLQKHLADMAAVQARVTIAMERLQELQAALAANDAGLTETRLVEQVLLELKPANDQEILRWKTAGLQLWTRELQQLHQDAMDLKRSLYFETWKSPALPADLQSYPEEFIAYLAAGRYSPEAPSSTSPAKLTQAHLDQEIAKHMAVLDGIANAVNQAWQDYQAERATGAQPYFDQQVIAGNPASPKAQQLFMQHVNAQIRRQIEFPQTREGDQFKLLIPFDMSPPPISTLPERLIIAGVAAPHFEKGEKTLIGKDIAFDITYRLAGELRRNNTCAYVDLSIPGGRSTATRRDTTNTLASRPIQSVRSEYEQQLSFEKLRQSRAAPPARTLYFLSVTVNGSSQHANWKEVPVLESFTFWRSIVQ